MHNNDLKILVVGDYSWPWYQDACVKSLLSLGYDAQGFGWSHYFQHSANNLSGSIYAKFLRAQNKFKWGPVIHLINRRLIQKILEYRPKVIFFYNVQLIYAKTIQEIKRILPNTVLCQYANDNPFRRQASKLNWRHFVQSLPFFDIHFVYRSSNLDDFKSHGAQNVFLLRSYFIKEEDFEVPEAHIPHHFASDVVFAGHYEDDGRLEMLEAICTAGYHLKIFGSGWERALKKISSHSPIRRLYPIFPVVGADYRFALCGAKVALCFLSKLNEDTYTRRNFQIPAMNVAMLSEYSDDLVALFHPNTEACFFRNQVELLQQLNDLLKNSEYRTKIAMAGHARVHRDEHDVTARMAYAMKQIERLL